MNMFWIYDLPNGLLALLIVGFVVAVNATGRSLFQRYRKNKGVTGASNEAASFYIAAIGTIYGIMLGLLAVGVWEANGTAEQNASDESSVIATLYRDVSFYPEPYSTDLRNELKGYTRHVIDTVWPLQRKGIVPKNGGSEIDAFQKKLYSYEPVSQSQIALHTEAICQVNSLNELRRTRMKMVNSGLSSTLWYVILLSTLLFMMMTWYFQESEKRANLHLSTLFAAIIGLVIFLIAAMDYPYRGAYSVDPSSFQLIYSSLMT